MMLLCSALFKNSELLNNPVVGVMIGVLVTVLVQSVTVEVCTGYLEKMTGLMVSSLGDTHGSSKPPDFLKVLTKPFTKSIIQVNKKVLEGWAQNDPKYENATTVLKTECGKNSSACTFIFSNLGPEGLILKVSNQICRLFVEVLILETAVLA